MTAGVSPVGSVGGSGGPPTRRISNAGWTAGRRRGDGMGGSLNGRAVYPERVEPVSLIMDELCYDDHPIAAAFPLMAEDRLATLAESVKINGLRHPVVLFEGQILDGRNRFRAAKLAEVELTTDDFLLFEGDWADAVRFVTDENLERRHLTNNERAFAAERLANLAAAGRPKIGSMEPISLAAAAELVGTGRESVKRARVVRECGVPELIEAAERNEIAVRAAAEIATLPPEEQRAVVAAGPRAVREAAAQVREGRVVRRVAPVDDAINGLPLAVASLKEVVIRLVRAKAPFGANEKELLTVTAGELRNVAAWIETLASGGPITDAALLALVSRGHPHG